MGVDIAGMSEAEAATAAAERGGQAGAGRHGPPLAAPATLASSHDDFPGIAKDALEDIIVAGNPRQVTSEDEVIDLLHKAW